MMKGKGLEDFRLVSTCVPSVRESGGRRCYFWFLFSCSLVSLTFTFYWIQFYDVTIKYYNPPPPPSRFINNYFLTAKEALRMGELIQTPTCRILNVSAWDEAILPIIQEEDIPPPNCRELEGREWTYTAGSNVVINVSALEESGYSMGSVVCCYFGIIRITQSIDNYDGNADLKIRYSSSCTPMDQVTTKPTTPFVRVHCKGKYWPSSSDILYRRFHAVGLIPSTLNVTAKVNSWKGSGVPRPPNVVVIGIDSMSRLSFTRTMPKTKKILQELGAIEMLGYTKVGENTFPNIMAALGGYSEAEMRESCFMGDELAQDGCPYLWDRFSSANYLTALIEDAPLLAIFNYLKTGFVQEPTDFYFRPFMLGIHRNSDLRDFTWSCVGPETVDEIILRYISGVLGVTKDAQLPLFLFSWMTNLAHGNLMRAKYADDLYASFLKELPLTNTLLFFMGDHGYRFGPIRQTFPGWYEDKLPNLWIYLSPDLATSHSSWLKSLQTNSARLTSTFDLFYTMGQLLDEFTESQPLPKVHQRETGEPISRRFGQSLFTEVSQQRTCSEAGINDSFCACGIPLRLPVNDTHLMEAAKTGVEFINSLIPPQCVPLKMSGVDAGAVLNLFQTDSTLNSSYIVAFRTSPGDFLFEATVSFHSDPNTPGIYRVNSDVLRMNKISTDVSCVHDGFLEKLCYCDSSSKRIVQSHV